MAEIVPPDDLGFLLTIHDLQFAEIGRPDGLGFLLTIHDLQFAEIVRQDAEIVRPDRLGLPADNSQFIIRNLLKSSGRTGVASLLTIHNSQFAMC